MNINKFVLKRKKNYLIYRSIPEIVKQTIKKCILTSHNLPIYDILPREPLYLLQNNPRGRYVLFGVPITYISATIYLTFLFIKLSYCPPRGQSLSQVMCDRTRNRRKLFLIHNVNIEVLWSLYLLLLLLSLFLPPLWPL